MANGAAYSGLCTQVVLIQRCISIIEVANGAAYSGHNRQMVFLCKWSLRQGSLYVAVSVGVVAVVVAGGSGGGVNIVCYPV